VAAACEKLGVPWDVRRTVSDVPGTVGPEVAGLVAPGGGVDVPALLRLVGRHPGQVRTLSTLAHHMRTALGSLTRAVAAELER
jgi:hypothetical protein